MSGGELWNKFRESLGDAGDEAADTVAQAVEPLEVREVTGASPVRTAAAPAPAVCEYRNAFEGHANRKWRRRGCTGEVVHREDYGKCPDCGLPIKFTEAK